MSERPRLGANPKCGFGFARIDDNMVDLLLEDGPRLLPREIKSSSTYAMSMSAGLKAFCALAPQATNPLVVYSGASSPNVVAHYADTESWLGDQ